jgi:hypothetical protein
MDISVKQIEMVIDEMNNLDKINHKSNFNIEQYIEKLKKFIRDTNIVCSKEENINYFSDYFFGKLFNKKYEENLVLIDFLKFKDLEKIFKKFTFGSLNTTLLKNFLWKLIWLLIQVEPYYNILELVRTKEIEIYYLGEKCQIFPISKFCEDKNLVYKEFFIILICVLCGGQINSKSAECASNTYGNFRTSFNKLNLLTILYHHLLISFIDEKKYIQFPYYQKIVVDKALLKDLFNYTYLQFLYYMTIESPYTSLIFSYRDNNLNKILASSEDLICSSNGVQINYNEKLCNLYKKVHSIIKNKVNLHIEFHSKNGNPFILNELSNEELQILKYASQISIVNLGNHISFLDELNYTINFFDFIRQKKLGNYLKQYISKNIILEFGQKETPYNTLKLNLVTLYHLYCENSLENISEYFLSILDIFSPSSQDFILLLVSLQNIDSQFLEQLVRIKNRIFGFLRFIIEYKTNLKLIQTNTYYYPRNKKEWNMENLHYTLINSDYGDYYENMKILFTKYNFYALGLTSDHLTIISKLFQEFQIKGQEDIDHDSNLLINKTNKFSIQMQVEKQKESIARFDLFLCNFNEINYKTLERLFSTFEKKIPVVLIISWESLEYLTQELISSKYLQCIIVKGENLEPSDL